MEGAFKNSSRIDSDVEEVPSLFLGLTGPRISESITIVGEGGVGVNIGNFGFVGVVDNDMVVVDDVVFVICVSGTIWVVSNSSTSN